MKSSISPLALAAALALVLSAPEGHAQQQPGAASEATKAANAAVLEELPFEDRQAFEDAHRGFIAPLPAEKIVGANGQPIWDPGKFAFLRDAEAPDTVNPSLWRQAQLVEISGLYEVTDGIYQVRNYDLSNMTIIEGETGLTIVDPLVSAETAKAALHLYRANRGSDRPVVAVIYTHSHADHFGGVRGVVDEADVAAGKVKIYAPDGFMESATAENVLAGTAMGRRASFQFGNLLPASPTGQVSSGLGTTTSAGSITLIPPTDVITETGQTTTIDGLTYEFLMAPGSEAPSEFMFYIPEKKALNGAENATHILHNTYTLRGAKIRDPLAWSKYLNQMIATWGAEAEVLYNQHQWPVWGSDRVVDHLRLQRDMYRFINDETLRLANKGYNKEEIAEMIVLPAAIEKSFSNRGYYGSYSHNVKGTYVYYLGWFDANPATLNPLPRRESGKRYVEMMGGADAVLEKARAYYDKGEYRWVAEVADHVVFADPQNQEAKDLVADAFEQMGYQAESGPWRNFYLAGAQELRNGVAELPTPQSVTPDTLRATSLDLFFDYVSVRLDRQKADGKHMVLNFTFPDVGETYGLELSNGVLNNAPGVELANADASVTLDRTTLDAITLGKVTMQDAVASGQITIEGDKSKLGELFSMLETFDFWFNVVTPNEVATN
jgi:alkyl sulfatase BDS1-like metallo-beta-lactamase superfamily hydrolase